MELNERIRKELDARKSANTFRQLKLPSNLVDFASNDYLGLGHHQQFRAIIAELQRNHTIRGAGGSRLLSGNRDEHECLEKLLAHRHRASAALLFNSGYVANLALFSTVPKKNDTILYDERIHACVKDGVRLSLAKRYSFKHNNLEDLKLKVKKAVGNVFIAVESVYSMDGDETPLKAICAIARETGAYVLVDEAHSTGIYGEIGAGLVCKYGLENQVFARVHTFGKAMNAHGAAVLGSDDLVHYLINFARSFIYTTAMPALQALHIHAAYEFIEHNEYLIDELYDKISLFKNKLRTETSSNSPIQPIIVGNVNKVKELAHFLRNEMLMDVWPVLSPTVEEGSERLRICLHNHNTHSEIEKLACSINEYIETVSEENSGF